MGGARHQYTTPSWVNVCQTPAHHNTFACMTQGEPRGPTARRFVWMHLIKRFRLASPYEHPSPETNIQLVRRAPLAGTRPGPIDPRAKNATPTLQGQKAFWLSCSPFIAARWCSFPRFGGAECVDRGGLERLLAGPGFMSSSDSFGSRVPSAVRVVFVRESRRSHDPSGYLRRRICHVEMVKSCHVLACHQVQFGLAGFRC